MTIYIIIVVNLVAFGYLGWQAYQRDKADERLLIELENLHEDVKGLRLALAGKGIR